MAGFFDRLKEGFKKEFVDKPAEQKKQELADKSKAEAKQFKSGDVYNNRILDDTSAKALNDGNTLTNAKLETLPKSKADTADKILASNDEVKAEKQKEETNKKIVETTDRQRVYDNTEGKAKDRQKASDKAKDLSSPDKAYDSYDTWAEYYDALKKAGKSDDEIEALLKGSKWEKEGSKYDAWKKSRAKPAEETKPAEKAVKTEQPKEETLPEPAEEKPAENPKDSAPEEYQIGEKVNEVKPVGDNLGKVAKGGNTYAQYLNSQYPSVFGAIFGKNSGLSVGERIMMGISVVGKLVGNTLLANGMSLLGDNSYFSRIGEGISLDAYTTEQQKKLSDAIAEQNADMLKDVTANRKIVDDLLPQMKDSEKGEIVASYGHVIATMDEEKRTKFLESQGFSPDEIKQVVNIVPALKYSSMRSLEKVKNIADVKTDETNQQKNDYEFTKEMFNDAESISTKIKEIDEQIRQIKTASTFDDKLSLMEKASNIWGAVGQIATAEGKGSGLSLGGKLDFKIKQIVGVDLNGSYNRNKSESKNESFNKYREKAIKDYDADYQKWMNGEGKELQEAVISQLEVTKEILREQLSNLQKQVKSRKMDDGTIPNGAIESIKLKDGSEIVPNENDGAVLTTSELPEALLSFPEGEFNPFDYLGYEGRKEKHDYYEHIFDKGYRKPIESFDEALALLSDIN